MVVDGRNKNQSGLFHFLSGAKAAPGVGQLGKIPFRISGFQPKLTMLPCRFLKIDVIFLKYRETSEFETFD